MCITWEPVHINKFLKIPQRHDNLKACFLELTIVIFNVMNGLIVAFQRTHMCFQTIKVEMKFR